MCIFTGTSGDAYARGLLTTLWESQLCDDTVLISRQSSCGNATDEVVTAKWNHPPILPSWDCSRVTLIKVSGVLKLFNHALIDNLFLSHHRWLMPSTACGFSPHLTLGGHFDLPYLWAVRGRGLLLAPWTNNFVLFLTKVFIRRSYHYKRKLTPTNVPVFLLLRKYLVIFTRRSKLFLYIHLQSTCFFPPKPNIFSPM